MTRFVSQGLQILGLAIVGSGLFVGVSSGDLHAELTHLAIGAATFVVGKFLEQEP